MNCYEKAGNLYQMIESLIQVLCITMCSKGAAGGRFCRYRNMHPKL